ncbi:putative lipase [Lachnellula cervina]|uniref:Putative lipase n=1 Tax=Lachnellula cervina TaxID=1316786 RepID=A0A7D8ZBZ1_9HELO|nr:putative lipase [Lachnellula cervina]
MAPIPFIGRLNPAEYLALVGSFFLVGAEAIIRILTLALPSSIISLCYRASRRLFDRLTSPAAKESAIKQKDVSSSIRDASDFVDICALYGYYAEEHIVQTGDGYLLGLHRLAWRRGEEELKVNHGRNSLKKNVIYMHHGLLMNSEVWVCLTDEQRCLPFKLVEAGYDVWLGNNRGNKYSKKSVHHSPTDIPFWNFSMDDFAFHDIPDSIGYILDTTSAPSLSYIGFSQGTAQAFAALAVHPKLNDQVNVFIALAPAMSPAGLSNGIVDALIKASPQVLFLLFGRRSILSSATMWQSILYPPIFVRVIDMGLSFLFGWHARNISTSQKLAAYPHLYSFTSTKSVVHWFQIIRTKSFQMYDDDVQQVLPFGAVSKYTKVAKFPTRNIKTPIVLVYGGSDSLVDIDVMMRELPAHTIATEIPHYEHLDFLWARDVESLVFPHVFDALNSFVDAEHTKEEYDRYRSARHASLGARATRPALLSNPYTSEDDSGQTYADAASAEPGEDADALVTASGVLQSDPHFPSQGARKRVRMQRDYEDSSAESSPIAPPHVKTAVDGGDVYKNGDLTSKLKHSRRGSAGSSLSFGGDGSRGISLGAGRAVSSVVKGETVGKITSSDEGSIGRKKGRAGRR